MKAALKINLTFEQILSLVKQLPKNEKIKLTKALENELIDSKLSQLLKSFKTDDLDMKTIINETETVRQQLYEKKKR